MPWEFVSPKVLEADRLNHRHSRLENPVRLAELNPPVTLEKIGLEQDHILCDIGAGSGIFTIPAARMTRNKVYALELDEAMLNIIGEKAGQEGLTNIELIPVKGETLAVPERTVDIILLVTVLHEIPEKDSFLQEINRITKDKAKIAVVEFHKRETPMGPPVERRLGQEEAAGILAAKGWQVEKDFNLGPNFYCLVLGKKPIPFK